MQTKAYAVLYYHFVWKTWEGHPLITEALVRPLYRCIESEVERLGGTAMAIGGTANHVHLVVQLPTQVSPSRLMQQVKGVSAQFGRDFLGEEKLFRWQHGYGVFTLSRPHLKKAISYTNNQKEHHDCEQLWSEWEQSEAPG
ncbi:MAG: transposase [Armatimonas sp.]